VKRFLRSSLILTPNSAWTRWCNKKNIMEYMFELPIQNKYGEQPHIYTRNLEFLIYRRSKSVKMCLMSELKTAVRSPVFRKPRGKSGARHVGFV
jgi:hypothetical protein